MESESDDLLNAEEAVQSVLMSLKELRKDVEGYSAASGYIDDARVRLEGVAITMEKVANLSSSVMSKLAEIGTPELIRYMKEVGETQNKLGVVLKKENAALKSDIGESLNKFGNALKDENAALKSDAVMSEKRILQKMEVLNEKLNAINTSIMEHKAISIKEFKFIKFSILLGFPLVIGAIVGAVFLSKNI